MWIQEKSRTGWTSPLTEVISLTLDFARIDAVGKVRILFYPSGNFTLAAHTVVRTWHTSAAAVCDSGSVRSDVPSPYRGLNNAHSSVPKQNPERQALCSRDAGLLRFKTKKPTTSVLATCPRCMNSFASEWLLCKTERSSRQDNFSSGEHQKRLSTSCLGTR